MTDKFIGDAAIVTSATPASDYLNVLIGGALKTILIEDLFAAFAIPTATESDAGGLQIATNAEVVDKLITDKIITPDKLYYALANALADKLVFAGATGSCPTGSINIPGEYLVNGVAVGGGDVQLVSTQDASGASRVAWTSLASGYNHFIVFSGLIMSSCNAQVQYSTTNGSAYSNLTGRTGRYSSGTTWTAANTTILGNVGDMTNGNNAGGGVIELGNLAATNYKRFKAENLWGDGTGIYGCAGGIAPTNSVIDAVCIDNDGSGSFTGKFSLYRRKI